MRKPSCMDGGGQHFLATDPVALGLNVEPIRLQVDSPLSEEYEIWYRKGGPRLAELLRELSDIEGLRWLRLLYCYPSYFTDSLITEIAENDKACCPSFNVAHWVSTENCEFHDDSHHSVPLGKVAGLQVH